MTRESPDGPRFETLRDLRRWCENAPAGTRLPASVLADVLDEVDEAEPLERRDPEPAESPETTWRERLWRAPSECRLGVQELAEGLGKSPSWVYNHTRSDAENPLPHRKLGGGLTFVAGEVRHWVRQSESVEVAGPSDPPESTLRLDERRTA